MLNFFTKYNKSVIEASNKSTLCVTNAHEKAVKTSVKTSACFTFSKIFSAFGTENVLDTVLALILQKSQHKCIVQSRYLTEAIRLEQGHMLNYTCF